MAHWTRVSDSCPLGYLFYAVFIVVLGRMSSIICSSGFIYIGVSLNEWKCWFCFSRSLDTFENLSFLRYLNHLNLNQHRVNSTKQDLVLDGSSCKLYMKKALPLLRFLYEMISIIQVRVLSVLQNVGYRQWRELYFNPGRTQWLWSEWEYYMYTFLREKRFVSMKSTLFFSICKIQKMVSC